MDLKGKRVLIFQQRGWGLTIGHFLAKKLQEEGCALAALTIKRTTHKFVVNQKDVEYQLIIDNDEIMGDPEAYLDGEKYTLKEICAELGIDSIWPMVSSVRNFVKSYKDKWYYGFKQNASDEIIINYVKAVFKFIKIIFNDFKPDIIIAPNIISLPHIMVNLYASLRGIKMISVTDSKIKGYQIFSFNYNNTQGEFYNRVDYLNNNIKESKNQERARQYIKEFRDNFKTPIYSKKEDRKKNLLQKIRFELFPYKEVLRWYIKGSSENYLKSMGVTLDYKPPKYILRDHYAMKKYRKYMNKREYYSLDKIDKFVYFPLQFQPEESIDVQAPYFSNQIEIARLVAMSLPDDYTLVVKEHPAMVGYRPPSYIQKIDRTPNVKLIDYRISSKDIIEKADLVISPNGTTIAEAAFLLKPVIQLGNLGTTLKLPNVVKHTDLTTLSLKIKEVLNMNFKTEEYERKLENFVTAVFDTGFDLDYITAWEKGKKELVEGMWNVFEREIKNNLK